MNFKIGDRVAIYHAGKRYTGDITNMADNAVYILTTDRLANGIYHSKQCRKLVKKKRRQFWIDFDPLLYSNAVVHGSITNSDGYRHSWNGKISSESRDGWFHFIEAKDQGEKVYVPASSGVEL